MICRKVARKASTCASRTSARATSGNSALPVSAASTRPTMNRARPQRRIECGGKLKRDHLGEHDGDALGAGEDGAPGFPPVFPRKKDSRADDGAELGDRCGHCAKAEKAFLERRRIGDQVASVDMTVELFEQASREGEGRHEAESPEQRPVVAAELEELGAENSKSLRRPVSVRNTSSGFVSSSGLQRCRCLLRQGRG